jgi:ribosomal protein S12 methylthiotransferase
MREAEALVKAGVKELLVVSQDTSAYGIDLRHRTDFVNGRPVKTHFFELAKELGELGVWVRLHYVYPYPHVDEVLGLMAEGKLLPYLDIPFQHGHPEVLKRMKRPAAAEKVLARIKNWRKICPDLTLRSTFIAGFPGETEAEFQTLLDFLTEAQIDRLGCFAYSPVEGATANLLSNPVPEALRLERQERVMAHQAPISQARLRRWVGRRIRVLIDAIDEEEGCLLARGPGDAPEIDGLVRIWPDPNSRHAMPVRLGEWTDVDIVDSDDYDLEAVWVASEAPTPAETSTVN